MVSWLPFMENFNLTNTGGGTNIAIAHGFTGMNNAGAKFNHMAGGSNAATVPGFTYAKSARAGAYLAAT